MKFPFWRSESSNSPTPSAPPGGATGGALGTFGGVYTPSILTILGVIMYLRFGWVVGNVGLVGALVIVTLANSITFLTALSICTIATDNVVRTGGAYYMISRSLGIETGGAVGIPLYFAQALSVALYTLGFAESVVNVFPQLSQTYVALAVTVGVAVLALTSASLAIRAQYIIMAAIVLSLVSFALGPSVEPVQAELWISDRTPFWSVFAVFFPAVTGIMAGVNMSGDLKNPKRSLPIGTLAAVGTGYLIYMILPILLSWRANPEALVSNFAIMQQMSTWGPAFLMGIWGATLSSAIGSIMGAPRVLQALARDGVLPDWMRFLGRGSGESDEPRLGTAVTLVVAVAAVMIGDLNLIAPVLSMFFLTTYLVLNGVAAIESFLQSPSFRPSFRVSWLLPLLGAVGCLIVMFLIDAIATVVAGIIVAGVYLWLQRRELETAWGDVRRGLWMAVLREGLLQIGHDDPKNWRPNLLVLSGAPQRRWPLIQLANAITHNRGLITIASILPAGSRDVGQQARIEQTLEDYLDRRGIQALTRVVTADNPFDGAQQLVETYGLGSLTPNTILLGDSESPERRPAYCQFLDRVHQAGRSAIILRENAELGFGRRRQIDVWWGGLQNNGGLMLLIAYLLRTDLAWRQAKIALKLMVPDDTAAQAAAENLSTLVQNIRIRVDCQVLTAEGRSFDQVLRESSAQADLVLLGLAAPGDDLTAYADYYEALQRRASGLPTTLFVLASPTFAFGEVLVSR